MKPFRRSVSHVVLHFMGIVCLLVGSISCKDLVGTADLPSYLIDPTVVRDEAGALSVYRGIVSGFATAYGGAEDDNFIAVSGLLTDELNRVNPKQNPFPETFLERLDARLLFTDDPITNEGNAAFYTTLNNIRVRSHEARGVIRKYVPNITPAVYGHLLAIEAMVMTMLAELYCSGIPLSTVDFERDYTVTAGLKTEDVYQRALALFDSAAVYATDSVDILHFAQLGRARVLLGLGRINDARDAVTTVPTDFKYGIAVLNRTPEFLKYVAQVDEEEYGKAEGTNGLSFPTDPRTQRPEFTDARSAVMVELGLSARLIEAEALLLNNDVAWLSTLNALRTICVSSEACATPAPAGTGGIAGLPPLGDPAPGASFSDTVALRKRLDMVFAERGYWLFLTGHRQGDLRRLIRNHGRLQQSVYPIGQYFASSYGSYVNLPVPSVEQTYNHLYRGCYDRGA